MSDFFPELLRKLLGIGDVNAYLESDPVAALDSFKTATDLDPRSSYAWHRQSRIHSHLGNLQDAAASARRAHDCSPDDLQYARILALYLEKANGVDEACSFLGTVNAKKPTWAQGWIDHGMTLYNAKRYSEAVDVYGRGLESCKDSDSLWFNRACAYARLSHRERCLSDLKQAIALEPTHAVGAKTDEDLRPFWEDREFQSLIAR